MSFDTAEVNFDGVRLLTRVGTFDAEMAREIFEDRYYTIGDGWGIPAGGTVLDIGGNIGAFAVYAALHGAAEVHTFEPIPESFDLLEHNIGGLPHVTPHKQAIATSAGTVRMSGFEPMPDGLINTGVSAIADDGFEVEAVSIHDVLATRPYWDVVKLDIEGYEYDLLGDLDGDEMSKIGLITMEFHWPDAAECEQRGRDLGDYLAAHGFDVVEVDWAYGDQGRLRARR